MEVEDVAWLPAAPNHVGRTATPTASGNIARTMGTGLPRQLSPRLSLLPYKLRVTYVTFVTEFLKIVKLNLESGLGQGAHLTINTYS